MSDTRSNREGQPVEGGYAEENHPEERRRARADDAPARTSEGDAVVAGTAVERERSVAPSADGRATKSGRASLFAAEESERYQARWSDVQTGFVDEPRRAVEEADELVDEVISRLTAMFSQTRSELERQWGAGDDVSTEDLRQALQRYRSLFERLLSV